MACWDSKTVKWFSVSASGKSKGLEQLINMLLSERFGPEATLKTRALCVAEGEKNERGKAL